MQEKYTGFGYNRGVKAIYLIAAATSLFIPALARAELKFEATTIELNPKITDKQAVGHFKYQNTGDKPIKFKSVKASCGCTAAQSQKDQVGPGEKGEITATFSIGDRVGQQVKTVSVETDDPTTPMTQLTLKTNIPTLMEITPNFVFWQTGENPGAKVVIARAGKDAPIKNLEVVSTNPQMFEAKVEKGAGEGEFKISVNPKKTDVPAYATVTVKTDYPKESPKTYFITARVTGPTTTAVQPASTPPAVAASPGH